MSDQVKQIKQRFGIIGNSPLLEHAIEVAVQVAPTDMSVLIVGESGVGKESFPKIIHQYSLRKHGPYIAVNCGAIPEGTIDSELFGHLKGSFTGAMSDRKGYFQEADGGTIFLDEVGELPLSTQARLLRVLETGEFIPVGASSALKTNVRIVAATNVNLQEAVQRGRFREDLLFRLNTVPIELPPLRKRREDIALLFRFFASQAAERYNMPALRMEPEASALLEQYHWPGNIRELRNLTDRISILEEQRNVSAEILSRYLPQAIGVDYRPAVRMPGAHLGADRHSSTTSSSNGGDQSVFIKLLLDMRQEITELRTLVSGLMQGHVSSYTEGLDALRHAPSTPITPAREERPHLNGVASYTPHPAPLPHERQKELAEDVEVQVVEASTDEVAGSLEEIERKMIISALKRHGGRRRATAEELQISERTLYRKIKEYGLDL